MEHISKRLSIELKLLTTDSNVQTYFHYESSKQNEESKEFYIYGYLLPRLEPYKYGSYKVCIALSASFPFQSPQIKFLTNIYHPAVPNDLSKLIPHGSCCHTEWTPIRRITQLIEQNVDVIDRPEAIDKYCIKYPEAKSLYDQNKVEYEQKVMKMIEKYSYPRTNQTIISLKFTVKQIIRKQLDFHSAKINQLPLSNSLKQYLDPSLNRN